MKISNYPPDTPDAKDPIICFCYAVRLSELKQAIQAGANSLEKIQSDTQASMGCGGCVCDILELLEQAYSSDPAIAPKPKV